MLVASTLGALIGAISSMRVVCATRMRPSAVVSRPSPRVPPAASCSVRRLCSSTIHTKLPCGTAAGAVPPTGRCARLELANSSPASGVSAEPKAMLSTRPARRYSTSARPCVRPLIGKLMTSVWASGEAPATSLPVQRTPHSRPSGPKARSPTRVLENWRHRLPPALPSATAGLNTDTPLPVAR